ncbi:MAG: DNA alkylation repair protein [Patescibacteria group bacterium]|jgi:3-methyladenine DNA glycosylase AlkD|nr:DNA alkylation repair protein [Patescibacteria group bacterium]MDD3435473.1 DNA alkylation repair protein [Patescibacteria group bacterium]MDD4466767.1 DNA alkylation repair protein [Patescibacteria group bacterium]
MNKVKQLSSLAKKMSSVAQAQILQGFFKTGPGEYGEGDIFWGLKVPVSRQIASQFFDLSLKELSVLISSPVHELRLIALLIAVYKYQQAQTFFQQKKIVRWYWRERKFINNWDLVDLSVVKILGAYLRDYPQERKMFIFLSQSSSLWDRRLAMVSTFAFIAAGEFKPTLDLARNYFNDSEDLIAKASGWMLREVGKRDNKVLLEFLNNYAGQMPRIMLRYAIERLPEAKRQKYLNKKRIS